LAAFLILSSSVSGAEKIRLLVMARDSRIDPLRRFFDSEPALDYTMVMTRAKALPDPELIKLIRLYFPRNYREFSSHDVLMLSQPTYYLFTTKQDKWIQDAIADGAGGINDGSTFSQVSGIPESWAAGLAQEAFPNDAPAVVAKYGGWGPFPSYVVEINRDHDEPILTVFVPFGVEDAVARIVSRAVIPREGSDILAWQVGNYPVRQPFLTAWEYGEGRAMTLGGQLPYGWFTYPVGETGENRYSPEILMNLIFWLADTGLIDDVEVFHRVKSAFSEFRTRLAVLVSLRDFIDKFGANTDAIQREMRPLEETYSEAVGQYLEHEFIGSEATIANGLAGFPRAEEVARREKNRALLWVFVIEWLVSASAFFVSGSVLWTLMVRRRLYRAVKTTKLKTADI
jgi:hypothetical protein